MKKLEIKVVRRLALILCLMAGSAWGCPGFCQTSADLETIIKTSNGIDSSRPIRAYVDKAVATVSTYSPPNASDQDCKINSLFIVKALANRYPNIQGLRITFYDSKLASGFRTIEVSKEHARRIDAGKPVQEVLATINIVRGHRPAQVVAKSNAAKKSPVYNQALASEKLLFPSRPLSAADKQQQEAFTDTLNNINSISKRYFGQ
jgi:hypothetical protein